MRRRMLGAMLPPGGSLVVEPRPAAEVVVDAALVRALLAEQHPDLAELPLAELGSGWDNQLFRVGDALTVRLPRRELGAELILAEQRWLPELAPALPLPVPAPVRTGVPGQGYPWRWSVCPWLPGEVVGEGDGLDAAAAARDLGAFVAALHRPAAPDAPRNAYRGVPLSGRRDPLDAHLAKLESHVDVAAVRAGFEHGCGLPPWSDPPTWVHGDLHPMNLLMQDGRLSAVIDFGDLTAGDPATDLSVAWFLLPRAQHEAFRVAAGVPDEATWERARVWALCLASAWLANSADDPRMWTIGQRALRGALEELGFEA